MDKQALLAMTDAAESGGFVDTFNPYRPWCESFRLAVSLAAAEVKDPDALAELLADWLEAHYF